MLMNRFFSFSKSTEYNILFVTKLYDFFHQIFNDVIGSLTAATLGEANICERVHTSAWISICMVILLAVICGKSMCANARQISYGCALILEVLGFVHLVAAKPPCIDH